MTALEAKRAADNFNQDLYNSVLNKISKYIESRIERSAPLGNYDFCARSIDDDLIIVLGKREVQELFQNSNLQKEIKKQFGEKGFRIRFENDREVNVAFMIVSWRMPYESRREL